MNAETFFLISFQGEFRCLNLMFSVEMWSRCEDWGKPLVVNREKSQKFYKTRAKEWTFLLKINKKDRKIRLISICFHLIRFWILPIFFKYEKLVALTLGFYLISSLKLSILVSSTCVTIASFFFICFANAIFRAHSWEIKSPTDKQTNFVDI